MYYKLTLSVTSEKVNSSGVPLSTDVWSKAGKLIWEIVVVGQGSTQPKVKVLESAEATFA